MNRRLIPAMHISGGRQRARTVGAVASRRRGRLHAVSIVSSPQVHSSGIECQHAGDRHCRGTPAAASRGDTMNMTLTAICTVPGTDWVMRSRRADAGLAPGGRKRPRQRGTRLARSPRAREAARWQRILDRPDPGKRRRASSPATLEERPVACTRGPPRRSRGARKRRNRVALVRRNVLRLSPTGHPALGTRRRLTSHRLSGSCRIPPAGRAPPP
jgi:hypothetical protein